MPPAPIALTISTWPRRAQVLRFITVQFNKKITADCAPDTRAPVEGGKSPVLSRRGTTRRRSVRPGEAAEAESWRSGEVRVAGKHAHPRRSQARGRNSCDVGPRGRDGAP